MSSADLDHLLSLENPAEGPALPIDDAAAERLVEGALAQAFPGDAGPEGGGAGGLAAATKGAATGALAKAVVLGAVLVVGAMLGRGRAEPEVPAGSAVDSSHETASPRVPSEPRAVAPSVVVEAPELLPVDAGSAPQASRGPRTPGAVAMPEIVLSDLELLGAANTARRERRWRDADALYGKVVERFPASSVSAVAALASGDLRLDLLGDAEGARERFRFAATRGEAHALDAYEGLLKACVALHDVPCERSARAAIESRGGTANEKSKAP